MVRLASLWIGWLLLGSAAAATAAPQAEIIDPQIARADPDFLVQGEYAGKGAWVDGRQGRLGVQVIALGDAAFRAVVYRGGLPGDGWQRGGDRLALEGRRPGAEPTADLRGEGLSAAIADEKLTLSDAEGKVLAALPRTQRRSPTLGEKPPADAVVLFDGSGLEHFPDGEITPMKTLEAGVTAKAQHAIGRLHLEFRLSYRPLARGQKRSNSGLYLGGCPEIQVLDSFGLEGARNECGALYGRREPDVNMCLPPLQWQTYDVEFTPATFKDGKKTAAASFTVRHNGVVVHGERSLSEDKPPLRRIHLQRHGNRVQYRNIWLMPPAEQP